MTTLLASATATSATATEGDVKTFLDNLRTYTADLLGTDSTNKQAILSLLGSALNSSSSKTASYTVIASDRGKVFNCSGTWTMNITAAATLGDGFVFAVINDGTGAITVDPNLAEQINNQTSITVGASEFVLIYCTGTEFKTIGGLPSQVGNEGKFLTTDGIQTSWLDINRAQLPVTAGRYYPAHECTMTTRGIGAATLAGKIWFLPFYVGVKSTFAAISFRVSVAVAAKNARVGLYSDNAGSPGALLYDAGVASLATTGTKDVALAQTLVPGWYWMAFVTDATATASIYSVAVNSSGGHALGLNGIDPSAPSYPFIGFYGTQAYGSLPSTPPALTALVDTSSATGVGAAPGIFMKA